MLSRRAIGTAQAPKPSAAASPVLLAHGFTQNANCWGRFAETLGDRCEVVAMDAPGHGASGHDDADLMAAGELLLEAGGTGNWIGYSMGGRMMLHAALDDSTNSVSSLVLIGATGGIDDPAERSQRQARDHALADRIEAVGTTAFIDEWLATPLFASLSAEAACRAERLQNRAAGMAASLRNCGTGTQLPLWDRVRSIEIPVLVVAGSTDEKFGALGHRLSQSIGDNAAFVQVPGGHAVHLENPDDTAGAVMDWYRTI